MVQLFSLRLSDDYYRLNFDGNYSTVYQEPIPACSEETWCSRKNFQSAHFTTLTAGSIRGNQNEPRTTRLPELERDQAL